MQIRHQLNKRSFCMHPETKQVFYVLYALIFHITNQKKYCAQVERTHVLSTSTDKL